MYAAAWPVKQRYTIDNLDIIKAVIKKYDSFAEDKFQIHGYNRERMRTDKQLNAFEYLFGLGKHLVNKYKILAFNKGMAEDTVNPIGFELVNACLNDSDKIKILYKNLDELDINALEEALYESIEFVVDAISVVTKFKGNSRGADKIFHSKYQIMSMISTSFKEMHTNNNFNQKAESWNVKKTEIAKNLLKYYVYDIITNYWSEGGTGKIHAAAKPNRYMVDIPSRAWMVALDAFFERSMLRAERRKIGNPKSEEYVILNCIYLNSFTAMDQLSLDKFDVEHIAPKEQMRKLIDLCKGDGLPISSIANLCYLPDYVNRSKKDKNFYQDKKYLKNIDIREVEHKYSFTESEDLEWMDMPYEKIEDFAVLKEYYTDYCVKRFDKLKHLFCDSMGIKYETVDIQEEVVEKVIISKSTIEGGNKKVKFSDKCILRLARHLEIDLIKTGRSTYKTQDGKKGYVITTSKMYTQGEREKYWFAYRRNPIEEMSECEEQYIVYGCKDESTMVILPVCKVEERVDSLNISKDEEGNVTHWHIVFFKDANDNMIWLLSKPNVDEVSINEYKF